jgi:U3 small nucleolar RNA-associated protein 23
LLDGNFIHACLAHKVDLSERISAVLQGEKFKLLVPRTAIIELRALGEEFAAAYNYAVKHCQSVTEHVAGSASPAEQIDALIGTDNPDKYVVASQDEELRLKLRQVPGCPLMFLSKTVLLMEQVSGKTKAAFEKLERTKTGVTDEESEALHSIKRAAQEEQAAAADSRPAKRLKKRAGAPNPLSCLPKKGAKAAKPKEDKTKRRKRKKGSSTDDSSAAAAGSRSQQHSGEA